MLIGLFVVSIIPTLDLGFKVYLVYLDPQRYSTGILYIMVISQGISPDFF